MHVAVFQCRTQHCVCRDFCGMDSSCQHQVSMPHATLCVSGHTLRRQNLFALCFNAARSIVCVGTRYPIYLQLQILKFQCRTQHCVCRDMDDLHNTTTCYMFQCRTQHCVCRDSVSRSPCPARAEKVFWKDALFLRRFWRRRMNSAPKSGGSIGAVPCAVRAAPFWKDETAVCGFAPVPEHFPFPSPL